MQIIMHVHVTEYDNGILGIKDLYDQLILLWLWIDLIYLTNQIPVLTFISILVEPTFNFHLIFSHFRLILHTLACTYCTRVHSLAVHLVHMLIVVSNVRSMLGDMCMCTYTCELMFIMCVCVCGSA